MNSLEAKFILEACRSGDLDETDPKIAEAIQSMESDPELSQWFAASQEFDRAVIAKLKAVPVPSELAERIRAGQKVVAVQARWNRREWLKLAALLMLLAALAGLLIPRMRSHDLATFRNDMAHFMDHQWDHAFDLPDPDFTTIKNWLASQSDSVQLELPLTLASSRTIGCKTLSWHGNKATLICFVPKGAGTVVHILVVDRSAISDAPGEEPQHARLPNWNSAIWSRGDKTYLALTTADSAKLEMCL